MKEKSKKNDDGYFITKHCFYCIEEKLDKNLYFDEEVYPRSQACEKHQKRFEKRIKEMSKEQ